MHAQTNSSIYLKTYDNFRHVFHHAYSYLKIKFVNLK